MPTDQSTPTLINTPAEPTPAPAPAPTPPGATGAGESAPAGGTGATGTTETKPDANAVTKDNPFKAEELKLPEGTTLDPEAGKSFVDLVNKFGISRDAVNELVALQNKVMLANSEAGSRDWAKMQEEWSSEVMKDAEIGGTNWPKVQTKIGGLLDTYGTPELRQAFDLTGAGNNPHVVRFMSKVASVLSEGGFISSNASTTGERSAAEILYPNQGK